MDQARKLVNHTPTPGTYKKTSLITIPVTTASSLMELLKDITEETEQCSDEHSKKPLTEGEIQCSVFPAATTNHRTTSIIHPFLNGCLISPLPIRNEILLS
jgi:hypothetical protein